MTPEAHGKSGYATGGNADAPRTRVTAPNPDPLTAEDVPPFRRRPTDEEVAARLLVLVKESRKTRDAYHAADGYGRPLRPDPTKADEYPPAGAIVWLLWAVSLVIAALAGALVALWTVGRLP